MTTILLPVSGQLAGQTEGVKGRNLAQQRRGAVAAPAAPRAVFMRELLGGRPLLVSPGMI
jgi:hypothetical protein